MAVDADWEGQVQCKGFVVDVFWCAGETADNGFWVSQCLEESD